MALTKKKISIWIPGDIRISGVLGVPEGHVRGKTPGVILAHGAGNDMTNPLLVAVTEGLTRGGYLTLRFNFPYKEEGKKAPDRPARLQAAYRAVFDTLRDLDEQRPGPIFAGGKSLGGRMASMMVAERRLPAVGLIFLGYPLHPPGNTEKLRFDHLKEVDVPMLFVQGTRDPLCDMPLLERLLPKLEVETTLHKIVGGDHSFEVLKREGRSAEEARAEATSVVLEWLNQF